MRIALTLLVVAACGKSSAPDNQRAEPSSAPPVAAPPVANEPSRDMHVGVVDKGALAKIALGDVDAGVAADPGTGKGPPGAVTLAGKTSFDRTSLSADAVADKIAKQHVTALASCYRATLARDASIKGKATLALTVKPDGSVTAAKATAPDATLQSCFSQAMQTWSFPIPTDADGEPADAAFQITLELAPE